MLRRAQFSRWRLHRGLRRRSGNVSITSDATNPSVSIALSGTGTNTVGQLAVSPGTLNLGSVVVGTSKSASGTLTASGANVTVTGASTNNSVFTIGGLELAGDDSRGAEYLVLHHVQPADVGDSKREFDGGQQWPAVEYD